MTRWPGGRPRSRGQRGLTLTELLVTTTIIGVLAAVVAVGVGGAVTTGNESARAQLYEAVQRAVDGFAAGHLPADGELSKAEYPFARADAPFSAAATVVFTGNAKPDKTAPASERVGRDWYGADGKFLFPQPGSDTAGAFTGAAQSFVYVDLYSGGTDCKIAKSATFDSPNDTVDKGSYATSGATFLKTDLRCLGSVALPASAAKSFGTPGTSGQVIRCIFASHTDTLAVTDQKTGNPITRFVSLVSGTADAGVLAVQGESSEARAKAAVGANRGKVLACRDADPAGTTGGGAAAAPTTATPDSSAPSSSASTAQTSPTNASSSWTISASATDDLALASVALYAAFPGSVGYSLLETKSASGTAATVSFTGTPGAGDGMYKFYAVATDAAGNVEPAPASPDVTLVFDTTAPFATAQSTQASPTTSSSWTITTSVSDNLSGVASVTLFAQTPGAATYTAYQTLSGSFGTSATLTYSTYTATVDGTYTFFAQATDVAGNMQPVPGTQLSITKAAGTTPTGTPAAMSSIATVSLPASARFIAVDSVLHKAFVAVGDGFTSSTHFVSVIDGSTNSVTANIAQGDPSTGPIFVAVNETTHRVYVSHTGAYYVSAIDGAANTVLAASIGAGTLSYPEGIGANPSTNFIYVANTNGASVSVIDGASNAVVQTLAVGGSNSNRYLTVIPATNRVYMTDNVGHQIVVINGRTSSLAASVNTTFALGALAPSLITSNPMSDRLYVMVSGSSDLLVLDAATGAIVASVPVGGSAITNVAVDPTTNLVYVTNGTNTLTVITGVTNTVAETFSLPSGALGQNVGVDTSNGRVYVTTTSNSVVLLQDARSAGPGTYDAPPSSSATTTQTSPTSATSWTISASATDNIGLASVALYVKVPGASSYALAETKSASGTQASLTFTYSHAGCCPETPSGAPGTYSFYTRATDVAGNVEDAPSTADVTLVFDTTAPFATAQSTQASPTTSSSWTITTSVSDNLSGVASVTLFAQTPGAATYTAYQTLSGSFGTSATLTYSTYTATVDGTYTFFAQATDVAGNVQPVPGTQLSITKAAGTTTSSPSDSFAAAGKEGNLALGTSTSNNLGATLELGEPRPCGSIAATVWYRITPSNTGILIVDTRNGATNYDTVIALYSGSPFRSLATLACNDDNPYPYSKISASVTAGQTYYLQVGGFNGAQGTFELHVSLAIP